MTSYCFFFLIHEELKQNPKLEHPRLPNTLFMQKYEVINHDEHHFMDGSLIIDFEVFNNLFVHVFSNKKILFILIA